MFTRDLKAKVFEPEYAVSLAYLVFLLVAFLAFKIPVTSTFLIGSFSTEPSLVAYLLSLLGIIAVGQYLQAFSSPHRLWFI
jgi:hypothetical protein